MGTVRNCIDIVGITPESELPKKVNGQLIEFSEVEYLFVDNGVQIKNIYQVIMDRDIKGTKVINTPMNRIIVIDGYKKFKVAYYDLNNNMGILEFKKPYNLFYDIDDSKVEIEKTNIYIADAYFELVNNVIYCHMVYIADIHYFGSAKHLKENIREYKETGSNPYIENNESKKQHNQYDFSEEVSISQYNKIEFDKENSDALSKETSLIDIDSEYL